MVNWLPFEIWSTIFQFLIEGNKTTQYRVLLLQVNQEWRQIACAMPNLWTDLEIRTVDPSKAQFFLSHSGVLPIDVRITWVKFSATRNPDIKALTDALSNHVYRIRTLDIHVQMHKYADMLIAHIGAEQDAPCLESLCVKVKRRQPNYPPGKRFASLKTAFRTTPNLKHLSLPACPLPNFNSPIFSTSSIAHLTLDATPFDAGIDSNMPFNALLAVCQNLRSFTLKGSTSLLFLTTPSFPRLNMPRLTSVNVGASGWGLDILDTFRAPMLSDVRLDALEQKYHWSPEDWGLRYGGYATVSLRILCDRSPSIKRLDLAGIAFIIPETIYAWLFDNAFPMLEELRFEHADISDDLLAKAAVGVLPRLRRLEICNCAAVSDSGIFAFLSSWHERQLNSIRISFQT
ncbi:hypothetical protein CPC08DRAFT_75185 [Agrocybe pediades]|nr:hypothetical protein CPC08DRAFT_75185 [Agrocybe pediades]